MDELKSKIVKIFGSRWFYWAVFGFFVFEALWIAFSARYPMAFDEDFHFGVIKVYSQQWLPFLSGQPDGANAYGALATDPSYLFHYLMSFPYRFVASITDSQAVQVVFLRVVNIAIISAGVLMFRKVLVRAGSPLALVSVATLLFALIPAVALVAGQINYDSLMLLGLAWVCWLVLRTTEDLRARKVEIKTFVLLAASLLVGSLVKYAFLPLALAVFIYVVVTVWLAFRGRVRSLGKAIQKSHKDLSNRLKFGLLVVLAVSAGLFMQRYVANVISYGNPLPSCDAVIGVDACMEYGPWARNYSYAADKPEFNSNPITYTWTWLQGLHYRLFFTITGPPTYTNYPPSPLPSAAAIVLVLFSVVALLFYWRQIFDGRPYLVFLLLTTSMYIGFLWFQRYGEFLETGRPVAINGRYLIPLLFPVAAILGRSLAVALQPWKNAKTWAATAVILMFLQGGGVFGFILRSDETWLWPNRAVVLVNETANMILDPLIFEGPKHYEQ